MKPWIGCVLMWVGVIGFCLLIFENVGNGQPLGKALEVCVAMLLLLVALMLFATFAHKPPAVDSAREDDDGDGIEGVPRSEFGSRGSVAGSSARDDAS